MERKSNTGMLVRDTEHSFLRANERAGLTRRQAVNMMNNARRRGITSADCTCNRDKKYLEDYSSEGFVAVAYNGYCFILEAYSRRCITMFALPRYFGRKKHLRVDEYGDFCSSKVLLIDWEMKTTSCYS